MTNVHLLGIGGSGMSALARLWLSRGAVVTGADLAESATTRALAALGAVITYGPNQASLPAGVDTVVYSAALEVADPAFIEALKQAHPQVYSYSQALGLLAADYKVLAVAGTHGKTTTTAMLGHILQVAGLSPTVILGGELQGSGSNFLQGTGEYLVVEADEYRRNFLSLQPFILVINNIDLDHLDYYSGLADIESAFAALASQLSVDGALICRPADPHLEPILQATPAQVIDYGQVKLEGPLPFAGDHNRSNARAALAAAELLGVGPATALAALQSFPGVRRRFEYAGESKGGARLYHDYAHNPPKVAAAIAGARELFPEKRLVVAFQPHLFSRTKALFKELAAALAGAHEIHLAPIYAAREAPDDSINSPLLAQAVAALGVSATAHADLGSIAAYLEGRLGPDDLLIAMGAGDIYRLIEHLV